MKRILINATHPEEIRSALVDGQSLFDLDIENRVKQQKKANIYLGTITRIESSLEAAFVDYGAERHGFLPLKEVSDNYKAKDGTVKVGTEIIAQVEKEERGNKGASLTTYLSLAGRYLVLLPNNPQGGGISRRIEGAQREEVRNTIKQLDVPKQHNIIVRTAVIGHSTEELQWDINYLVQLWDSIEAEAKKSKAPHFLFQESNIIIRSIRDYLRPSIGEVLIDEPDAYNLAMAFIGQVMPEYQNKVKLYNESVPLFNHYQIERQIETAFEREVKLPSGGSIVIDMTEALTAVDVNSAKATRGGDIEETALNTNLEAADEVAKQLRLRDLGGLVVIDFIDMLAAKNRHAIEDRMRRALKIDRARIQTSKISNFGLMEMSRQRLRPSLDETIFNSCPRCDGLGRIRGMRSLALSILRLVEEEAQKEGSQEIRVFSSVDLCTFLLNEKRSLLDNVEKIHAVRITILPQLNMSTPHYEIVRIRDQDNVNNETSYSIKREASEAEQYVRQVNKIEPIAQPAIRPTLPSKAPPAPKKEKETAEKSGGLFSQIMAWFSSDTKEDEKKDNKKNTRQQGQRKGRGNNNNNNNSANKKPRQPRGKANDKTSAPKNTANNKAAGTTRATEIIRQKNRASYSETEQAKKPAPKNNRRKVGGDIAETNNSQDENQKPVEKPQSTRKPRQRVRKEPEGELREVLDRVEPKAEVAKEVQAEQPQDAKQEPIIVSLKSEVEPTADTAKTADNENKETTDEKKTEKPKPKAPRKPRAKKAEPSKQTETTEEVKKVEEVKEQKSEKPKEPKQVEMAVEVEDKPAPVSKAKPKVDTKVDEVPTEAERPKYQRPANDPRNKRKVEEEKPES